MEKARRSGTQSQPEFHKRIPRMERDDFIHSKSVTCRQGFLSPLKAKCVFGVSSSSKSSIWRPINIMSREANIVAPSALSLQRVSLRAIEFPVGSLAEHFPSKQPHSQVKRNQVIT